MVQFVVVEEVDEVFSKMKTEEMVQKASQKVRAVTYHVTSIQDHMTPNLLIDQWTWVQSRLGDESIIDYICCICKQ